MSIAWRYAGPADCGLLGEWNHQLIADEGHRNPMDVGQLAERMAGWIAADYKAVIFSDTDPMGYALFTAKPDCIHLRQLFIRRGRRRLGLGTQAFGILRSQIWPNDVRLTVDVLCSNAGATAFWRSLGYQDYALTLEIDPVRPGTRAAFTRESYPQLAVREFSRMKKLADAAIAQVSQAQFFEVPAAGDNSIAVIVKHVGGNLVSRWTDFLTADGEKPGRNRDTEFSVMPGDSRENLMKTWEQGWATLFASLAPLGDGDLGRTITIRREPLSVLQAISRQLTHYSYHVGQIVYVAKHFAGGSWRSLSIPLGASATFNKEPAKYVAKV